LAVFQKRLEVLNPYKSFAAKSLRDLAPQLFRADASQGAKSASSDFANGSSGFSSLSMTQGITLTATTFQTVSKPIFTDFIEMSFVD
jgi:hypothetical protein